MNGFIIPPEDDGTPRCKFCLEPLALGEEWKGVCDECADALKGRYIAMLNEFFDDDEIEWLWDEEVTTARVSGWLEEVVNGIESESTATA